MDDLIEEYRKDPVKFANTVLKIERNAPHTAEALRLVEEFGKIPTRMFDAGGVVTGMAQMGGTAMSEGAKEIVADVQSVAEENVQLKRDNENLQEQANKLLAEKAKAEQDRDYYHKTWAQTERLYNQTKTEATRLAVNLKQREDELAMIREAQEAVNQIALCATLTAATPSCAPDGSPMVDVDFGVRTVTMSTSMARALAVNTLDAAAAADSDSALRVFLVEQVGITADEAEVMVTGAAEHRERLASMSDAD